MSGAQVAFVRASLVYLVLTGAVGVAITVQPGWTGIFRVVHAHAGVLGFFLSFVMGVAFWLMPRPGGLRTPRLEAAAFVLFHGGLATRMVADPFWRMTGADWTRPALVVAAMATLAGMALFAAVMARRAVPAAALQRRRRPASSVPDRRS